VVGIVRKESRVFDRWELKYVVTIKQMYQLIQEIDHYVIEDEHSDNGLYKIKSLYYDTYDFRFYQEKISGNKYRQKLRLRGYGDVHSNDEVFFEIKQRYSSTVQKRRVGMHLDDAYSLINDDILDKAKHSDKKLKVIEEVRYLQSLHALEPKAVVSYDRKAFMGRYEDGLRITFDTNLKCRNANHGLEGIHKEQYFMHPGLAVLEIKTNEKVPIWLISLIQRHSIEAERVSKYCLSVEKLYNL